MKKISLALVFASLFSIQNAHAIDLGKIKLPKLNTPTTSTTGTAPAVSAPAASAPAGYDPYGPIRSNDPANVRLEKQIGAYVGSKFGYLNDSNGVHVNVESAKQLISSLEAKYGPSHMVEGTASWLLIADKAADTCINMEVPAEGSDYATKKAIVRLHLGGGLCTKTRNLDYGVKAREVPQ